MMEILACTFSERHGFAPGDAEIVTREGPSELKSAIVDIAYEADLIPSDVRRVGIRDDLPTTGS